MTSKKKVKEKKDDSDDKELVGDSIVEVSDAEARKIVFASFRKR